MRSDDTTRKMPSDGGTAPPVGDVRILYETIRDLTSTLSISQIIQRLIDRVLSHLESEIASILLVGRDRKLRITHAVGLPSEVIRKTELDQGDGISGYVAETGEALLIKDVEADPRFKRRNHERYYTHSAISVPVRIHGRVMGVINVNNKRNRQPYRETDLKLVEAIAGHAAVALFNAQRYEETLRRAQCDSLTGLANHGHFWSVLHVELQRATRYSRELAVVVLDIDQFKAFNDRHGHIAGDEALVGVAKVIDGQSRVHDITARYGGEEFAIVLPETGREGAAAFAEKLRAAIESRAFSRADPGEITISAGVAAFPGDAQEVGDLVEAADTRLYQAKEEGRNRVVGAPEEKAAAPDS
jgi:diguanylate cyclase (GGDEF)-like protein